MPQRTPFWFLNSEVTIQLGTAESADGTSVMLFRLPKGEAPPVHVHRTEDEIFHMLSGTIRFQVDGTVTVAGAGETVLGPKGLPHGFRVLSEGAEMLVITRGAFERMVTGAARPALRAGPPDLVIPTPEQQEDLFNRCAAEQIDLVGPPID